MSHYNCCVPHCTNSFRNAPYLHYYRIPKDPDFRRKYVVLIRNETLKVNSESTRIFSAHFDGGEKLSRTHLPSIFPWTKQMVARRELKRVRYLFLLLFVKTRKAILIVFSASMSISRQQPRKPKMNSNLPILSFDLVAYA